jgi:hypothetical protein
MVLAVLFVFVTIVLLAWPTSMYLWKQARPGRQLARATEILMWACFVAAPVLSIATWLLSMRSGVRALQQMDRTPT